MVDKRGERLISLLAKSVRAAIKGETTTPEAPRQEALSAGIKEPMMLYWEKDKEASINQNQPFIDLYREGVALERIPDTVDGKFTESHYEFGKTLTYLPEIVNNINEGVPETPKTGTGISSSSRDAGMVAGIVVGVISVVILIAGLIAVLVYRHYVHRNVRSMNFDNPVYHKTTENQFAIEKNGTAPGTKLYPSTVAEEAQEPLNKPGTNDFV